MIDPTALPTLLNLSLLGAGAAVIWLAGAAATKSARRIATQLDVGEAFVGMILLGVVTSLPEVATTGSAARQGHAELAGSNLLGGVAMQLALLAAVDAAAPHGALMTLGRSASLRRQSFLLVLLLAIAGLGIASREPLAVGGIGAFSSALALAYVVGVYLIYRREHGAKRREGGAARRAPDRPNGSSARPARDGAGYRSWLAFAVAAVGVIVGGYTVAETGAALAAQLGLGESFVGATLVAITTSLPEVSTTLHAVRVAGYGMAIGNILGTNVLEVALLLPADLLYLDAPILSTLGAAAILLIALGLVLTALLHFGMHRRRIGSTVLGFGPESLLVLVLYFVGTAVLYRIG